MQFVWIVMLMMKIVQAFYNFWVNIANFYNTFVTGIAYTGAGWKVRNCALSPFPFSALYPSSSI